MKEKYTAHSKSGINEVKFIYSPLGDILLGDFALRNLFREIERYYHEGY